MATQMEEFGRVSVLTRLKHLLAVCIQLCLAIPILLALTLVLAALMSIHAGYKFYAGLKLAIVGRRCEPCGRERAVFRTGQVRKEPNIKFNVDHEVWEFRCRFCGSTFEEKQDVF